MPNFQDPTHALSQALSDMRAHLQAVRPQVAAAMADERQLSRKLEAELAQSRDWEAKAMLALRAGDEGLARAALVRKAQSDRLVVEWRGHHQKQREAVEKLKSWLRLLTDKAEQARRQKDILIARARRAQAQNQIQATLQGLNGLSAFDTLARIEAEVDRIDSEAEAQMELASEMSGDALASRFRLLEQDHALEDQLAQLKARMGVGATPALVHDDLAQLKAQMAMDLERTPVAATPLALRVAPRA